MGKENKSYRIRTNVDKDTVVNFSVDNTIDNFEILSLNINQANAYKLMGSGTGIIAGRVLANGGFGVPNVKVSVFIEYDGTDKLEQSILYHFASTKDLDYNGVRYNLLPNEVDDECHQNIGTFPAKRVLLDNDNWIEVFDKYYKFTTRTNESGDYMIYGVPTGMQTVHMDVDLSDIGVLSQRPRDLIYKGYNANMFESPGKFKVDTNIDSLAQVITQDQSVYVYPFWGDTTDSELNASITRCDMNVNYKFEPTCIFMGSVVSDTGENSMSKKCIGANKQGKMSEMITGEGKIEMIRKTTNGQVEQFSINGDNNINSDGVWCYQIPMNLDYVMTDEFGKMVMTDNPNTGIPTRARVRFRLSMAESPNDATARKRARFLIPNNPHLMEEDYPDFTETKEVDYEFGTKTKNENFRDLFWNNVYTVKSYIPRLQKSKQPNNLRHLGIKMVNHSGGHNPIPFNNLRIKFNFVYSFLCTLVKVLVTMVRFINAILSFIGYIFYQIGAFFFHIGLKFNITIPIINENIFEGASKLFVSYNGHAIDDDDGIDATEFAKKVYEDERYNREVCGGVAAWFFKIFVGIGCGIELKGLCETDDGSEINVTPGTYDQTKNIMNKIGAGGCNDRVDVLYNCIENQLAQDNDVTSFNFYNDWLNGVVYLPLWYRKIKKRRNGEIKKDQWCSTDNTTVQDRKYKKNLRVYATNTPKRVVSGPNGQRMGTIAPLANNESTVKANANDETGSERIKFSKINDENCYGYQCHKYSRTYFKVYKGLVFEKITMLGDKVYYYKPCDYDPSTGNRDLVTLFATDIVLLGSLNSCDLHGIPQFFKALESTTYNMPPDLLSEYYDYINEDSQSGLDEEDDSEIDMGSRMTENTGADWGNLGVDQSNKPDANENQYDNGGLFYGLTCFNSYTKPKSCINLSRICEFGVSLDESIDVPSTEGSGTETGTDTLTPDGFVSYDEIYNPDYRSMFATLNANFLRTKLNPETGLIEYDFNHMYLDNFDGSLKNLMMANTVNGKTEKSDFTEKANYVGNHNLEQSSDTYLNFRYGNYIKRNNKKIYYYENNNKVGTVLNGLTRVGINGKDRLPRYENSFYFYFGLNEGKTAIDKFNNEFFSDCSNNFASDTPYEMTYLGNSWCPPNTSTDGYIAFNMNIDAPFNIRFTNIDTNDVYEQSSINSQKFIFYGASTVPEGYEKYDKVTLIKNNETAEYGIMPGNGIYDIEVIDAYDNSYEDRIVFELPRIGFVCDVNPFNCRNVDLLARFGAGNYVDIANYGNTTPFDINNRDISGYISISEVNEENFKIELTPINRDFFGDVYEGVTIIVIDGGVRTVNGAGYLGLTENNGITTYYLGVPYANQRYKIRMTMMCDSETESNNTRELNVIVYEDEFKVYINGIDYNIIKSFRTGWNDAKLTEDGEFKNSNIPPDNSSYDRNNLYGWDDVLNIGTYDYNGTTKGLKPISYSTDINEILAICDVLSTTYEHNGTGDASDTTPYSWTEDYCYNAPSTNANYYTQGTVQRLTYTYKITEGVALFDSAGQPVNNSNNIKHGTTYYTDSNQNNEAVLDVDYIETGTYETLTVTRIDKNSIYFPYLNDYRLYNGDVYFYESGGSYFNQTVADAPDDGILAIDVMSRMLTPKQIYYNAGENTYYAKYTVEGVFYAIAIEDENGIITMNPTCDPNVEYSDLECMSRNSYSMFIDEINGIINNRGEFSRQVGGAFRTNDGETSLTLTTVTKARPVRYLIVGSGEITDASELYEYKPDKVIIRPTSNIQGQLIPGGNSTTPTIPGSIPTYKSFNDLDNTTYNGISNIRDITNGYVVDDDFETPSLIFNIPTLTISDYYTEYSDDEVVTGSDKYYRLLIFGEYEEYNFDIYYQETRTVGEYKTEKGIIYPLYKKNSDFFDYKINDKSKHPYYTSVINDNNCIVPATDDYSNFTSNSVKNLLLTFGVHFYDKPLTSEIKFMWSGINNTPTYPKYPLGNDTVYGFYYNIKQAVYYLKNFEYPDDSVTIPQGTVVYGTGDGTEYIEYTVAAPDGETVNEIKQTNGWDYLYRNKTNINGVDKDLFIKINNPGPLEKFYNGDIIFYSTNDIIRKRRVEGQPKSGVSKITYINNLGLQNQSAYYMAASGTNTIRCIPVTDADTSIITYYPEDVSPTTDNWIAKNGENVREYNSSVNPGETSNYSYSSLSEIDNKIELTKNGTTYEYKKDDHTYTYYGDIVDYSEITDNWKPIDVLMPGFLCGYLYNGMPADSAKSNIKAVLNENEVKLDTINNNTDVYENNRVKRLIYTNYTDDENPTYGTYKWDTASNKKYQYTEVPLVDDYLVYTDGYGEEYRYPVDGTVSVAYEYPVITYYNFHSPDSEVPVKYEDYLITKTYYTNDNGYLRHQSLYYIFDLEKTDYPLIYYKTNTGQASEESNLVYDENTQSFYFKEMPDIFKNLDESGYISKSKSTHFNLSNYIRHKYTEFNYVGDATIVQNPLFEIIRVTGTSYLYIGSENIDKVEYYKWGNDNADPSIVYTEHRQPNNTPAYKRVFNGSKIDYSTDKFFTIACCDNCYTISPIIETQKIRMIYNYEGFNNSEGSPVYIVSRSSRDFTNKDTIKGGLHYVEDFYYLNFYRFIVKVAAYDADAAEYNAEVYTQVCSIMENTAEKCYIKVTDTTYVDGTQQPPETYWASAIKINMSSLGKEAMSEDGKKILPWLHLLISDKTRVVRKAIPQTSTRKAEGDEYDSNVEITEYLDKQDMMNHINNATIYYKWTTENDEQTQLPLDVYTTKDYNSIQAGDDVYKKVNGTFSLIANNVVQYKVARFSASIIGVGENNSNVIGFVYNGYETV